MQIREYQMPRTHRIVVLDDVPEHKGFYHEALFRLQGVIYERELPPLKETRTRIRLPDAPYLRQHVGITGLGLAYMTDAVDNIHRLYAKFERALQSQDLHPWAADQSCGYNTMEFQQIAGTLPLVRTLPVDSQFHSRMVLTLMEYSDACWAMALFTQKKIQFFT
ncbi:hypothetical protein K435DRAFT_793884 [Dendrothele bispora CBS 962.96]|uniref:Uncharacterized protein n=1 Tax=Dendrothele bispora (strain CBS 962.96) TaxID=1314807 RepID=A0A4S8ME29_DENBC|nr:hypothetical protein K435DRAFT_793884 [Dendrothele bispora CBS 962.96]